MDREHLQLFLNRLLANYFVLYIKLYRYQWLAKGEHIILLKPLFREWQQHIHDDLESLAEHILSDGGKPFASMVKFIKESSLEEASADDEENEIIAQLFRDVTQLDDEISNIGIANSLHLDEHVTYQFLIQLQTRLRIIRWKCKAYYRAK